MTTKSINAKNTLLLLILLIAIAITIGLGIARGDSPSARVDLLKGDGLGLGATLDPAGLHSDLKVHLKGAELLGGDANSPGLDAVLANRLDVLDSLRLN